MTNETTRFNPPFDESIENNIVATFDLWKGTHEELEKSILWELGRINGYYHDKNSPYSKHQSMTKLVLVISTCLDHLFDERR